MWGRSALELEGAASAQEGSTRGLLLTGGYRAFARPASRIRAAAAEASFSSSAARSSRQARSGSKARPSAARAENDEKGDW